MSEIKLYKLMLYRDVADQSYQVTANAGEVETADPADPCEHSYWRNASHPLSNVSSVEAMEDIIRGSAKAQDKTESSTESKSKSPKYNLPKFLRTSFSRLISKDRSKSGSLSGDQPVSLPFFSSVSIPSLSSPTFSPSQQDMMEEPQEGEY